MWLWSRRKVKQNDEEDGSYWTQEKSPPSTQEPTVIGSVNTPSTTFESDKHAEDPNRSTQAQAKGWKEAHERFKKLDEVTMREYSEEVDTVLVFAGLFSAILTAFIVEVYKGLQEDPAESSAQLLRHISIQLANPTVDTTPPPDTTPNPSATIVAVNMLWFSSLILSLFAALIGILVKQWLHVYSKWPEREQPKDTVILRYVYQEGFFRWHVPEIIGMLPVLLQIALLLFVVGLVAYMWTLNRAIAGVLTVLVTTMILVIVMTIILPLFSEGCPYKSPVGLVLAVLKARYLDKSFVSDLSSWQRRDLSQAKPRLEVTDANDVVAQSGLILDLAPRVDLEMALDKIIDADTLLGSRISSLPEENLRLLFELAVASMPKKSRKEEINIQHVSRTIHLLEYISRVAKGNIRQNAAEAVISLVTMLGSRFEAGLFIVWNMVQRDAKGRQQYIKNIPWRCAEAIHSWGRSNEPKSQHTIRTCLYSMGVAAETLSLCSDDELQSIVQSGSYDTILNALQFWIESASKNNDLEPERMIGEERFHKLWERHRAAMTKFSSFGGHIDSVFSVAISPSGTRIVSGSGDKTARVWDPQTGATLAVIEGHIDWVSSVEFSPDGSRIVSGSGDSTVRVWESQTGMALAVLEGHTDWVNSAAFSPDGLYIVSGSRDKTVRVWDLQTQSNVAVLEGHTDSVFSVAFSPDGSRVISGSNDKTARIWDPQTGIAIAVLKGHKKSVFSVAFSPDGLRVISGSGDRTVRVWSSQTGASIAVFKGHKDAVFSVAFSPDGSRIISGSADDTVRVWDSQTKAIIAILEGHTDSVESVVFAPDGSRIVSGSSDNTIRVWDLQTGATLAILKGNTDLLFSTKFSPDGSRIISASRDETVRVWDSQTGAVITVFEEHTGPVTSVAFSPDGSHIISGSSDKTVRVWNSQTGTTVAVLEGHTDSVYSVTFSPDGSRIVSGSCDNTARVWDSHTGATVAVLEGHKGSVESVAFTSDGSYIVSGSSDETALVWDPQTGETLAVLEGHIDCVRSVAFSPDGSRVVSGSGDKTVRVWDSQIGMTIAVLEGHTNSVDSVAFTSDGLYIVSDDSYGDIRTWDAQTYLPVMPLLASADTTSPSPLPLGLTFESGWLLCKRPNDDFARRLRSVTSYHKPYTPVVFFDNSLAYGAKGGSVVRIDYSTFLKDAGHVTDI